MIYQRPADERGAVEFSWLKSKHSFSFGHYYDPKHMGVSVLRVINDDTVAPGAGFDTHGHRDMEIISYVLEGAIVHKDSMGNEHVLRAGEVQRMTAGTGVAHSEFNDSKTDPLKFLQIWVQPKFTGLKPGYEQKKFEQTGKIIPLVTQDGRGASLSIHQDMSLYRIALKPGETIELEMSDRTGYLHVIDGEGKTNHLHMQSGDGLAANDETLSINAGAEGLTALWFDLPRTRLPGETAQ